MSPELNTVASNTEVIERDKKQSKSSKKLEILIDGFYYDVTNFISRHPGGSVISYYTEKGEDATQAFQQFHNRSDRKVKAMLKSFDKRPVTLDDVSDLDPSLLKRHQEMTKDVTNLFLEIKEEGLFEPSYIHAFWRIFELFLMLYLSIQLCCAEYFILNVMGLALGGLTAGRGGFFAHETGHNALTGNPQIDRILQSMLFGFFNGLSANWWNRNHNRHHAMPQRLHHDVDLDTMPFMAYNEKVIQNSKQGTSFWIRNQTWLFLAIDAFLGVSAWRIVHSPRNALRRRHYFDLFFMALHWYFVLTYVCFRSQFWITWLGANYLYGNFALSHTHTPIAESSTHWLQYGLTHTVDISHNILVDWWMGWLNYQIEHHLFPTMPHFRAHRVAGRVKALAEKYGLPYRVYGYWEAWAVTLKNIHNVPHQFAKSRGEEKAN